MNQASPSSSALPRPTGATRRSLATIAKLLAILVIVAGVVYGLWFVPVAVNVHVVRRGELVVEVMGTGTLESRVHGAISPKIAGRIAEIRVDQGDRVTQGQILATLDDRDFKQQVAIAQASRAAAEAAVDRLLADRNRADAVLAQNRSDYERLLDLLAAGNASSVEFDKATEALSVAEAELARAVAAITEGRRQIIVAEKTLAFHEAQLADTIITAPFSGLIVRRYREQGDVVVPGVEILSLISTDQMWVSAWVDETAMVNLAPGQPARVVFRSQPDGSFEGEVVRLGREVDRETREFVVDVRVKKLPGNWAVGQRAEAYIETTRKTDVVLLPAERLERKDAEHGVFIAVSGRAVWRPLKLGLSGRENVEVLRGLSAGERIITPANPKTSLTAGRRITLP